jgi:hypothetical protein
VDAHTLTAVTPAHFPGAAEVVVFEYDFGIDTQQTFTFEGAPPDHYERLLLPLLIPPVQGAFGSEFHTKLSAYNRAQNFVSIEGLSPLCILSACPLLTNTVIEANAELPEIDYRGTPGRFVFVDRQALRHVGFNLRAFDTSRLASNFGTELPIVKQGEFSDAGVVLPAIPMTSNFRNTLRIYSDVATDVVVSFAGREITGSPVIGPPAAVTVRLTPGTNIFEPAYGVLSNFTPYPYPLTVMVEPLPYCTLCPLPHDYPKIWAFMTVTNNETQAITTITPQQ